jgi:DNA replication protein DnaC
MKRKTSPREGSKGLDLLLRSLKLPGFVRYHGEVAERAEKDGWGFEAYLHHLAELEVDERKRRRIDRLRKSSGLPPDKTLETLETARLPAAIRRQVPTLSEGTFAKNAENVLAFGLPGRGKTHVLCAIGHELIQRGFKVLFLAAFALVQRLLAAKKALALEKELQRLDAYDVVLLDDIGYIQQDREEMEVFFTFLAERYERKSVMISSNLVFSQWDRIFKDPMTTAAAIDRLVHHAIILELTGPSYRSEAAKNRNQASIGTEALTHA